MEVLVRTSCRNVILLGLALAPLVGCSTDIKPATIIVPFTLGNQKSCQDLDIVSVRAELDAGEIYEETVDCDKGEIRFDGVLEGKYELTLFGQDKDGIDVMDSLAEDPIELKLSEGQWLEVDSVVLGDAPAKLLVGWSFERGGCQDIAEFSVSAWKTGGSEMLLTAILQCDAEGDKDGYVRVPDPKRLLSGDQFGEVGVVALGANGAEVGDVVTFAFDPPGRGRSVRVSVTDCRDGCKGTGKPD